MVGAGVISLSISSCSRRIGAALQIALFLGLLVKLNGYDNGYNKIHVLFSSPSELRVIVLTLSLEFMIFQKLWYKFSHIIIFKWRISIFYCFFVQLLMTGPGLF